jgi:type IV pilus assembly protein PilA
MGESTQRAPEAGFTLVELMVVILIIGILIAVALPTYLGSRTRAQDRAAQTNLRTGLAAAMTYWAEEGTYRNFTTTEGRVAEPSLDWQAQGTVPAREQITIQDAGSDAQGQNLLLVTLSRSGTFFCVAQLANSPAFDRGHGAAFGDVDTTAECIQGW